MLKTGIKGYLKPGPIFKIKRNQTKTSTTDPFQNVKNWNRGLSVGRTEKLVNTGTYRVGIHNIPE
jgi:hypothetical protein